LPLLALALVTFGAILVHRFSDPVLSDCQAIDRGQTCRVFYRTAAVYWWTALLVAYVVVAAGHLRVARARELGTRIRPYLLTGVALVALSAATTATLLAVGDPYHPDVPPASFHLLVRALDPTGVIGLALLVLAWLERHVALLLFALGYLVVVLVPVNFGWGAGWGDNWGMAPQLAINGGLLLLGSAGFALAGRLRRPR
jgi:hypothetical protein